MAADEGVAELQRSQRPLAHKPVLALRNRRAMVRIMFKAKCGVLLMRNRNCFSAIGTTLTSVAATAVALRGAVSMSAAQLSMLLEGIDWRRPKRTAPGPQDPDRVPPTRVV